MTERIQNTVFAVLLLLVFVGALVLSITAAMGTDDTPKACEMDCRPFSSMITKFGCLCARENGRWVAPDRDTP